MIKEEAIQRLKIIARHSSTCEGWHYEVKVNNWEKYGKSRIYLSIVETRDNSKHHAERRYGYIDNATGEYITEKHDLMANYTFGGMRFDDVEVEVVEEIKVTETGVTKADTILTIEKIIANFEELMKDRDDIEVIRNTHEKIISNIKKDEFGTVTEDFRNIICDGNARDNWGTFVSLLDSAKRIGRDYRK